LFDRPKPIAGCSASGRRRRRRKPNCSMRTERRTEERTKGQTDMTKPIVAFRNFANSLKKCKSKNVSYMQQGHNSRCIVAPVNIGAG
jgi:hypothetical protein